MLTGTSRIKRAYRRRALELHPDRNLADVETATRKFAEIQSAYEVLSDPQERAWYDSHRDAILSGQDQHGDSAQPTTFRNVRLTSTEEILSLMRKFNTSVPFDDETTGFFGIARETFEHLALEEEATAEFDDVDCPDYPTFGCSDDPFNTVVKSFYNTWVGFSTKKSFSWKDKYRLSDAPDRRVRRLMEKENKKSRDDAIREFNDAVKFLVSFVRKRDPRYIPNTQTESDRQNAMRAAREAQAARSRAANRAKIASSEVPEWARSKDDNPTAHHFPEAEEEEGSEVEVEVLECVVCNKTFKSDKQLEAHERSKKHIKAVQQLRRDLRREGTVLDLDTSVALDQRDEISEEVMDQGRISTAHRLSSEEDSEENETGDEGLRQGGSKSHSNKELPESASTLSSPAQSPTTEDGSDAGDYAPRSAVEERLLSGAHLDVFSNSATSAAADAEGLSDAIARASVEDGPRRKVGKARAKRERKAAAFRLQQEVSLFIAKCNLKCCR